jgi:hypothetical protein
MKNMDDREVRVMKGIVLAALCVLAGCAAGPTLEELEAQAFVTGDWSLVEKRERQIERRNARQGVQCPVGYVAVCIQDLASERCNCVDRGAISMAITYGR